MFNLISKRKAAESFAHLVKAYQQLQIQQSYNKQGFTIYGYDNKTDQINAYASIADLYAIVNKIAKTAALIPLYEYNITNKKAYGKFRIEFKKYVKNPNNRKLHELKKLQEQALELAGEGSPMQEFIDNPNKFQSKAEFYQLTFLFKLLAGNYYLYKDILTAAANEGKIYEMYNLPPNYTFPIASADLPRRTMGYRSNLYNVNQQFELEQVIHGKYANPVFDFIGNELIGLSPLTAMAKVLTTIGNETDYANQALKNAGAGGVIVNKDAVDLTVEQLGEMKDDVLRQLGSNYVNGTNKTANSLGFMAGNWEYLKIFIDPVNMELLEQAKFTFKRLCNGYGISDKLFNNDDGSKYDNYDIALKELYTNAALPIVSGLCDDFNNPVSGLVSHFGNSGVVGYDVTDIPELQENINTLINSFTNAPAFRVNDLYESLGYGRLDDPNADVILVKQGYAPLDDVAQSMNINLDQLGSANDYGQSSGG